jgi:hypothetical protein
VQSRSNATFRRLCMRGGVVTISHPPQEERQHHVQGSCVDLNLPRQQRTKSSRTESSTGGCRSGLIRTRFGRGCDRISRS